MRKNIYYSLLLSALVTVSVAEETRQVDKHEHGVGELNIAVEGNSIDLEFMIPGADIVGFEYKAKSEADIALVNDALIKFDEFNNIFSIPSASNCNLVEADISINQGDNHKDEHNHDGHDDHDEHEDDHDEYDDHDEHEDEHDRQMIMMNTKIMTIMVSTTIMTSMMKKLITSLLHTTHLIAEI